MTVARVRHSVGSEVVAEIDRSGSGTVYRVIVNGVLVWSWALHIDGALDPQAVALFNALQPKDVI